MSGLLPLHLDTSNLRTRLMLLMLFDELDSSTGHTCQCTGTGVVSSSPAQSRSMSMHTFLVDTIISFSMSDGSVCMPMAISTEEEMLLV